MRLKLNMDLLTHKKGDVIEIADRGGIPTNKYWRKRIKDSKIDNCVEVITIKKKSTGGSKK